MAYSFGGNTGETAESLRRKRAYVQAMLEGSVGQSPDTVGGGIAVLGQALAGRVAKAKLDRDERKGAADALKQAGANPYIKALLMGGGDISGSGGSDVLPAGEGGDYFANIKSAESGGNPNAKNPKSSATGLYQFTDGTWSNVARQHPELGLTPDGRRDPRQQELAIRAFTNDNAKVLASAGIEPTGGNLYAAHFLGAGGAKNVLSQPDGVSVAAIVGPGVVKANPFLAGMTVGQFRQWTARKGGSGSNVLAGGEENDTLGGGGVIVGNGAPRVPMADGSFASAGFNTRGPNPLPPDRLVPRGPMPQPQMAMPNSAPIPQQRPMPAPQMANAPQPQLPVDQMQTAAIPQRPRGIVSPRAEDNGYTRGPGAASANMLPQQGMQSRGLLGTLLGGRQQPNVDPTATSATDDGGMMQMYQLLDSPYLPDSYKAAIVAEIKRKQEQADPVYQQNLRKGQLDIDKAEKDLNAPAESYRQLSDEEEKKLGLDPANAYQVDGANKIYQIGGGGVNVNVGEVKTPTGYRPLDPNNPGAGVEPIPGGPAEQITPETAARLGMAEGFIQNYPAIEDAVRRGGLTGLWDRGMASIGRGEQGNLDRQIRSGTDALQRMLTGAGMPATEAAQYANRYLPGVMDDAESAVNKLKQLKYDLEHAGEVVGRGRGGSPITSPAAAAEDPLGIR